MAGRCLPGQGTASQTESMHSRVLESGQTQQTALAELAVAPGLPYWMACESDRTRQKAHVGEG